MFDFTKITFVDGQNVKQDIVLDCLLNNDLTDSFFVSEYISDQAVTIQSNEHECIYSACVETPFFIDDAVFSIQSNNCNKAATVSVKYSKSTFYSINKKFVFIVCITVDNFKSFTAAVKHYIQRIINEMKGNCFKHRVYALRLLRL